MLFLNHIIGGFADALDACTGVEYAETAGDGLFIVVADVIRAAECCFALRDVLLLARVAAAGLPDHLGLRLSAYVGPLYKLYDRVIRRDRFCGMEVIRTARIEPITPVGEFFVTEQFAASLAWLAGEQLRLRICRHSEDVQGPWGMPHVFVAGRDGVIVLAVWRVLSGSSSAQQRQADAGGQTTPGLP